MMDAYTEISHLFRIFLINIPFLFVAKNNAIFKVKTVNYFFMKRAYNKRNEYISFMKDIDCMSP